MKTNERGRWGAISRPRWSPWTLAWHLFRWRCKGHIHNSRGLFCYFLCFNNWIWAEKEDWFSFLFSISLCHIRDRIQLIRIMKKERKRERARGRIEITSSTLFSFRCPWRRERIGSRFLSRLDNPTSVPLRVTTCMLQGWASPKCMSVLAKIKI